MVNPKFLTPEPTTPGVPTLAQNEGNEVWKKRGEICRQRSVVERQIGNALGQRVFPLQSPLNSQQGTLDSRKL
jgi:hypothetical protein